ncbi:hypothetical protein D3C87_1939560 [compost metagenome]
MAVGIGEVAEVAQGPEAVLYVLDSRFHDALLLWVPWRTGINAEAIALGTLGVGPLDFRLIQAGPDDGALGVIDDEPLRHSMEPFKGMPVTLQPGGNGLVTD